MEIAKYSEEEEINLYYYKNLNNVLLN